MADTDIVTRLVYTIYTNVKSLTKKERNEFDLLAEKIINLIDLSVNEKLRLKYFESKKILGDKNG